MHLSEQTAEFAKINLPQTVVYRDEDMKKHTSFQTGGRADLLIEPGSAAELQTLMQYIITEKIPYLIIGQGSNTIVSDGGLRQVVIKIGKNLSTCTVNGEILEAEAGALLADASQEALKNSLTGLEFASGIPGSIGGAVFMNAGAYDSEIKHVLQEVLVLNRAGELITRNVKELALGYRSSLMQKNGDLIVSAKFRLQKGDPQAIQSRMDELKQKREQSQPLEYPSAGSIFKRPAGHYTGKLIQEANLKGFQIGGAQVSEKHAGFIINRGNATTADIRKLIQHIQREVKAVSGVELETEVRFVGEMPE